MIVQRVGRKMDPEKGQRTVYVACGANAAESQRAQHTSLILVLHHHHRHRLLQHANSSAISISSLTSRWYIY